MNSAITQLEIRYEQDVVQARQQTHLIAELLGLDRNDQVRISAAVSEIARNAFQYGAGGRVEFLVESKDSRQTFTVVVRDRGPGISNVQSIFDGCHTSPTGMGVGLLGARRMVDHFHIETKLGEGTTVFLGKTLPASAPPVTPQVLAHIGNALIDSPPESPLQEIYRQNRDLLHTLEELHHRQERLEQLNQELQDTNRGVLALYTELDDKSAQLSRSNRLRANFLANISHELRTPLNSILALSRLLLDRVDGDLTAEQEKQAAFIHKAAEDLTALVNNLLDQTKIDSGKVEIWPRECFVEDVFSGLRGMFKPMETPHSPKLIIEPPEGIPSLFTDDHKVGQILRNLVSNALKFTERGEVRLSARLGRDDTAVLFTVADTGIGIAPEDQQRIFDEYVQVQAAQLGRPKGSGLGLAISRKLAEMLGGRLDVASSLGAGSTFTVLIPLRYMPPKAESKADEKPRNVPVLAASALDEQLKWMALRAEESGARPVDHGRHAERRRKPSLRGSLEKVLIIDDEEAARYILKGYLADTCYTILEAGDGVRGVHLAKEQQPDVIFLDLLMPGMNGLEVLQQLKSNAVTREIPVIINTNKSLNEAERRMLGTQTLAILSKKTLSREEARQAVLAALRTAAELYQQQGEG